MKLLLQLAAGAVFVALGFVAGYRYATKPAPDANPEGPRVIHRDRPAEPPKPQHIQTPDVRTTHPLTRPDTVCLAADASFTLRGLSAYGLEGVARGRGALRTSFAPAVAYVDPATDRLAVTRRRSGALVVPYTYRGETRFDEFRFIPPAWDVSLEIEALLAGPSLVAPGDLDVRGMAWLRIRRWHVGAGVLATVDDVYGSARLRSVAGLRWRPWSLR